MENKIERRKSEKELRPQEKKIAMSLESFKSLEPQDKVFLILVWRGLKTASPVTLQAGAPESELHDLEKRIKAAGLFLKPGEIVKERSYGQGPGKMCFVANNQKDLDLISELWSGNHARDEKVYREIGRMSGYPQSAIDAYDKIWPKIDKPFDKNRITPMELMVSEDEKIERLKKEPELIPFAALFYMSRENFDNELNTVRKWANEIKSVTPMLYEAFISNFIRFKDKI